MTLKEKYGKTALVAGASEGLGAEYARYLAAAGFDLVLVARRPAPLQELATALSAEYGILATCISCDLAQAAAASDLKEKLADREINLLVYNAAIPYIGEFEKNTMAHHNQIAQANMVTPMNILHLFGDPMLQKGRGAIVLMASLAGFQGSGFLSMYAATKAFDRVLAEGLWYEWRTKGVDVIACCAGATATPNFINTKPEKIGFFDAPVQEPKEVVAECFQKIGKTPSFVSGSSNKWITFFMQRLLPRKLAITIMGDAARKMYRL
ncbi:MAG: hypothetical protein RI894_460 [Bacteroidota bacterium]|jgi:short-subunit dehydrogenase